MASFSVKLDQSADSPVRGKHGGNFPFCIFLPGIVCNIFIFAVIGKPLPFFGDTDGDNVIVGPVDLRQNGICRLKRYGIFAGAASEQHGNRFFIHRKSPFASFRFKASGGTSRALTAKA